MHVYPTPSYRWRFSFWYQFTITTTINGKNSFYIDKQLNFKINIKSHNQLIDVYITKYDHYNNVILSRALEINSLIHLDKETIGFLIAERYEYSKGERFLNKIIVNHNDFKDIYYYEYKIENKTDLFFIKSLR